MKILAIESSCDETAAAVVEGDGDFLMVREGEVVEAGGVKVLSNVVVSQIDIFAEYGGVIPEVAARSHLEVILPVVHKAMEDAGVGKDEIDAIAVTHTPGLLGSLLVGTLTARVLAILWNKPLYAVHHLKSHIYANWLGTGEAGDQPQSFSEPAESRPVVTGETHFARSSLVAKSSEERPSLLPASPEFPLVALIVSGGHTQIIYMEAHNKFEIIGTTRDDAVGECFDKVAKILGLPYPGGPAIEKLVLSSPEGALQVKGKGVKYPLPIPKVEGLDFSFSGLKTAVLRAVQRELGVPIDMPSHKLAGIMTEQQKADFAASFLNTAVEILVDKMRQAVDEHPEVKAVVLAGGVSASEPLRQAMKCEFESWTGLSEVTKLVSLPVFSPERKFAGDNAAMVGAAAYYEIMAGVKPTDPYKLNIAPRTPIYS